MAILFRRWPLFDILVNKYWSDTYGWIDLREWDSKDISALELFANAELQRRGEQHDRADTVGRVVH